jgi:hypothetical protein
MRNYQRDALPSHSAITWAMALRRSSMLPFLTSTNTTIGMPKDLRWYTVFPFVAMQPVIGSGLFRKAPPNCATKRLRIWRIFKKLRSEQERSTHRSEELRPRLFCTMTLHRPVLKQYKVHVRHDLSEKRRRNAGTALIKFGAIVELSCRVQVH